MKIFNNILDASGAITSEDREWGFAFDISADAAEKIFSLIGLEGFEPRLSDSSDGEYSATTQYIVRYLTDISASFIDGIYLVEESYTDDGDIHHEVFYLTSEKFYRMIDYVHRENIDIYGILGKKFKILEIEKRSEMGICITYIR